jgi:hypothetical protein
VLKSRGRILSGQPEPHPFSAAGATSFTAAGALKKCSSGAKPDVKIKNRTIIKKQVLWSLIKNPGKNVDVAPEPPEPHQSFNPKSEPRAA